MEELQLDSNAGVIIMELLPDSPAEKAGMLPNDVILKIDDRDIADIDAFVRTMQQSKPGQEMKFSMLRAKKAQDMTVTLGKRPADFPGMQQGEGEKSPKSPTTKPD
jgi:S1-C subfamily serine protease